MNSDIRQRIPWHLSLLLAAAIHLVNGSASTASWPTYQHDKSRSGATTENAPGNPELQWAYHSPSRPIPAWDEPALWDGWSKVHDLKNRQVFDKAFHVAADDGRVYFGSSVEDKVYCLDSSSGNVVWTFFTEGPVRLAPTLAGPRLYVGSDDGFVYCLEAETGHLHWKYRPGPNGRRVAGNERIISPWAIRTSVVADGDTVYCGAGVIPSENVYVCALKADTGTEIWKTEMNDVPPQGYMLASKTRLYIVTSRDRPVVLDASTGKRLLKVGGGTGGTYALLTGDTLLYGPSKTGEVNMIGADSQDVLASFQGNHMIVASPFSYLQSGNELSALDRDSYVKLYAQRNAAARKKDELSKRLKKAQGDEAESLKSQVNDLDQQIKQLSQQLTECLKWRTKCDCPFSLILAGDVLIAGGDGEVMAVDAATGTPRWHRSVPGKAYGLAVADGRLFVSTDEGTIHCFADGEASNSDTVPVSDDEPVRLQSYAGPPASSKQIPEEIDGPFAEFVASGQVRISWDTDVPMTSALEFGVDLKNAREWTNDNKTTEHEFFVDQVQRDVVYRFRVGGTADDGREIQTEPYRFDAHFDYLPVAIPDRPSPYPEDELTAAYCSVASQMLDACEARRGYALVLGSEDGRLAYELARVSSLKIVIVEPDAKNVERIRSLLDAAGLYGSRVTVHQRDFDDLPYGPFLANLVVAESMLSTGTPPAELENIYPCLRPAGGTIFVGTFGKSDNPEFETWRNSTQLNWFSQDTDQGNFWVHKRAKLPGTGEWTHQYASPDNSACSKDDQVRGAMAVQWWGRPGARPMPDRGGRNPPPVSANGRLYVQGNRTLFGLDAYNGTILWAKQIPAMRRANMPRDGSNMVATDEHVCVAIGKRCVAFDGQTGKRLRDFEVPEFSPQHEYDWGYVSRIGTQLFGTAVRRGSHYLGDQGEWYEGFAEKEIARVTSDSIFALNVYSGKPEWLYSRGVLINSTITMADGRIFFIEGRCAGGVGLEDRPAAEGSATRPSARGSRCGHGPSDLGETVRLQQVQVRHLHDALERHTADHGDRRETKLPDLRLRRRQRKGLVATRGPRQERPSHRTACSSDDRG